MKWHTQRCHDSSMALLKDQVVGSGPNPGHLHFSQFSHSVMPNSATPWTMPGFSVHHQLPEPTQIHVHLVGDATQPPHPPSSPPAFNLSQHQGLFKWVSSLGRQSIGVSASALVLPMNIQDWFPLGLTGWLSLQSKGLSRVFSNTIVQKHQFFRAQPSLWSNFHTRNMTAGKTKARRSQSCSWSTGRNHWLREDTSGDEKRPRPYSRTPSLYLELCKGPILSSANTVNDTGYQPTAPTVLPLREVPDGNWGTMSLCTFLNVWSKFGREQGLKFFSEDPESFTKQFTWLVRSFDLIWEDLQILLSHCCIKKSSV